MQVVAIAMVDVAAVAVGGAALWRVPGADCTAWRAPLRASQERNRCGPRPPLPFRSRPGAVCSTVAIADVASCWACALTPFPCRRCPLLLLQRRA